LTSTQLARKLIGNKGGNMKQTRENIQGYITFVENLYKEAEKENAELKVKGSSQYAALDQAAGIVDNLKSEIAELSEHRASLLKVLEVTTLAQQSDIKELAEKLNMAAFAIECSRTTGHSDLADEYKALANKHLKGE